MKLPIKNKYFNEIKKGIKHCEYRDAHITFVNEKTGETMRKEVISVGMFPSNALKDKYPKLFKDKKVIEFVLD